MPNWCHNTLTVSGEPAELARFIEAARPQEDLVRQQFDNWPEYDLGNKPEWEEYWKNVQESQPLSFESLSPPPSAEELDEYAEKATCWLCGGTGQRPRTEEEAVRVREETKDRDDRKMAIGEWVPWVETNFEIKEGCNGCNGTGIHVVHEGWYEWRLRHWGCKWDASFSGPMLALGDGEMNVDATVEAQGATLTPQVAIYKFDTPWSPPSPLVETASEKFPELEFTLQYGELGHELAGRERYIGGLCVEEEELEIEDVLAPEERWF